MAVTTAGTHVGLCIRAKVRPMSIALVPRYPRIPPIPRALRHMAVCIYCDRRQRNVSSFACSGMELWTRPRPRGSMHRLILNPILQHSAEQSSCGLHFACLWHFMQFFRHSRCLDFFLFVYSFFICLYLEVSELYALS